MKFITVLKFIVLFSVLTLLPMKRAHALDARSKVFLTVTGYGVAAGTLLGTASLAFGAKPRAIAVGASLGLYAGLIFGTYIVVSHAYRQKNPDVRQYPDTDAGPYSNYEGGGDAQAYRYEIRNPLEPKGYERDLMGQQAQKNSYYINFFNLSF